MMYDYTDKFERELQQKYTTELKSYALTKSNPSIGWLNERTIKLPRLNVSGYQDHDRDTLGFNSGTLSNSWEPKVLTFDRDIEFFIDAMDTPETGLIVAVTNLQITFEKEQAIPEKDSYRFSKLYAEAQSYTSSGAVIDTTALDASNILDWFDEQMAVMDDLSVPEEGRMLYTTPAVKKILKSAEGITRTISAGAAGVIDRRVHGLDDVSIIGVPSARLKTLYDFTNGCTPAAGAKQINMILIHPSCVISRDRYSYIRVFAQGHDSRAADSHIFQNRYYTDTFLIERKACGIAINAEA